MHLSVQHSTTYRFEPPMRGVTQSLRLWPSRFEGQIVHDWSVDIEGAVRGAAFREGSGDWIETAVVMGPVSEVVVRVGGTIETTDLAGVLRGHRESINPLAYLRSTVFTQPDPAIRDVAQAAAKKTGTALDRAHGLADAIHSEIAYTPGQTDQMTTAAEALGAGRGVCQDHAHALIAAALSLGVPARYITGYLHAEGDIAEASHAWAELFVDDLGWVGFDASNGQCPDEHYIRLGSGFDAEDAAPIRGIAQGRGTEALDVDVQITDTQQ
jgi:transglutaminase-like putative cysteine protease